MDIKDRAQILIDQVQSGELSLEDFEDMAYCCDGWDQDEIAAYNLAHATLGIEED